MEQKLFIFLSLLSPLIPFIMAVMLLLIGYPLVRYAARIVKDFFNLKVGNHMGALAGNTVYYGGLLLLVATLLTTLGINISALLGAAGVIGLALGFAAQTTISNVISGVFLLLERPFSIGDEIECDSTTGIVESIDPLSVKLRTKSNQLVRIPNELLIKKSFINHSFYPIVRLDIPLKVREHDVEAVRQKVYEIVTQQVGVLAEPAVQIFITQVTSLSTLVMVRFWVNRENCTKVRRQLIALFSEKLHQEYPKVSIG